MSCIYSEIAQQLGPNGPGYALVKQGLPEDKLNEVQAELEGYDLPWTPKFEEFVNARGIRVKQAFDVFAHKLSCGEQEILEHLPALSNLSNYLVKKHVQPLAEFFPSLENWQPDEIVSQRYPENDGGLTYHKDLMRHPGMIVIANVIGLADLLFRDREAITEFSCTEGGVVLMRAPGLFNSNNDIRPEHAVGNIAGAKGRISITMRANSKPNQPIANFSYHNARSL